MRHAELVGWQVVEALTSHHLVVNPLSEIEVGAGFDEYIFTLIVRYRGDLLPLAKQPPSAEELMASTEAELRDGKLPGQPVGPAPAPAATPMGCARLRLTFGEAPPERRRRFPSLTLRVEEHSQRPGKTARGCLA